MLFWTAVFVEQSRGFHLAAVEAERGMSTLVSVKIGVTATGGGKDTGLTGTCGPLSYRSICNPSCNCKLGLVLYEVANRTVTIWRFR